MALPPPLPGTALRILGTSDLGANAVPLRTTTGWSGTTAGISALLEREERAIWLDLGDLVVGNPSYPLLRERPWADVVDLPIAAAAAGNHDFDDGIEAVPELPFPLLCANADAGLPATAIVGDVGVIGLTHPQVDRSGDQLAWNWCRMPASVSGDGSTTAVLSAVLPHLRDWLGRDVTAHPTGIHARDALVSAL
jgi:hypothetical protein